MTTKWPNKDPDEKLDFSVDWRTEGRLPVDDAIDSSLWIVPVGITVESESYSDTLTTIWLSGGTIGQSYDFINRVTTLSGRIMDKTVRLKIKVK
jgi:hypothetical protein